MIDKFVRFETHDGHTLKIRLSSINCVMELAGGSCFIGITYKINKLMSASSANIIQISTEEHDRLDKLLEEI